MKKPNSSKIKRAVTAADCRRKALQRDAYAKFTTPPLLEHVYKNRSLRSALDIELKSPNLTLPQTNCLWHPTRRTFRSLK